MTTKTREQWIKNEIHALINCIAECKKISNGRESETVKELQAALQWFYAALANEQDTTYPTL